MNVVAAGFRCGGEIVLRPNHRMRRGQGATPAAFYLGLCRLRGILSPPAPHDCAAGGQFFFAAAKIRIGRGSRCCHASCRLAVLLCRSED